VRATAGSRRVLRGAAPPTRRRRRRSPPADPARSVIKVILQFCRENALPATLAALQAECRVTLNAVDDPGALAADVRAGRWDAVLPQVAALALPRRKLEDLYEQVVLELLELREADTARAMLRQTQVLAGVQAADPERFLRLERLAGRAAPDARDLYGSTSRERRRAALASALGAEVADAPPARLMALIGQALKWQRAQGLLAPDEPFDLFRGAAAAAARDADEAPPAELDRTVKFGSKSHAECAAFSPDGAMLATGSVDGFIEVWDPATGRLRKDLPFQAEERFMMHEAAVLALAFSADGELLASGAQDGGVKVWRARAGQCLRRFDAAHAQGVTSLAFAPDGGAVLSASYDGLARVHGIKSGRALKEFRGHGSYVNSAAYAAGGAQVVTASSDGTVRVWDARSCECVAVLRPPRGGDAAAGGAEPAVNSAAPNPADPEQLLVCPRAAAAHVMTLAGELVRSYVASEAPGAPAFVACAPSPRGEWVLCLDEAGTLHCFAAAGDKAPTSLRVADKGPIGLAHHPRRNLVATFSEEGVLKTWKPA
jgi:WD40 repeat-containing protein SMU1